MKLPNHTNKDDKTIEERLTTINISNEVELELNVNRQPDASTLHTMLSQAIHANDKDLLENCLQSRDSKVILGTVKKIPTSQAVELLEQILVRLQNSPGRAIVLIEWIRSILLSHSSVLSSVIIYI